MQLRISPDAKLDLERIWDFIAADNIGAANRFNDRLFMRFNLICASPESGEERSDIAPGIRQAIVGPFAIYYRVHEDHIRILRVIHGARDMPAAFRE